MTLDPDNNPTAGQITREHLAYFRELMEAGDFPIDSYVALGDEHLAQLKDQLDAGTLTEEEYTDRVDAFANDHRTAMIDLGVEIEVVDAQIAATLDAAGHAASGADSLQPLGTLLDPAAGMTFDAGPHIQHFPPMQIHLG